ncbi:MAG: glycosyltransferase family 4 protein [Nitrospira sp.]|nr:MAG: glycosyltransferase family 4 protein [Nitrospira sp.]
MNLTVSSEQRLCLADDGTVWTSGQGGYRFFQRYLDVFDSVRVVARLQRVPEISPTWIRANGDRVSFVPVPYYIGPWQYVRKALQIRRLLRNIAGSSEAAILRVPSVLATDLVGAFTRVQHPYGVEVLGDPWDVMAPGVVGHPLRPFIRVWSYRQLKRQCKGACASAYVTKEALQRRYPSSPDAFWVSCSDVELGQEAFVEHPRNGHFVGRSMTAIMVGSLAQLYKAPDVLIDAIGNCVRNDVDLRLTIVGDGKYRHELEARARARGLGDRVKFSGEVPAGHDIRAELDKADLFVLPSRTEGLPRAMIEAMARGLPCIGSTVGGIPELLDPEDLVPPNDVQALATKLFEVVADPGRQARMAARNLDKARRYHEDVLRKARVRFYRFVKESTESWMKNRRAAHGDQCLGVPTHRSNSHPEPLEQDVLVLHE